MALTLEELVRRGARDLIQGAVEVEITQVLAKYRNVAHDFGNAGGGQRWLSA